MECYHGTDKLAANSILIHGFKSSLGDSEWLGDGVYTFTEGISEPKEDAKKWTEFKCWDNKQKIQKFQFGAVLKLKVADDVDKTLNLNTKDGVDLLKFIKDECIEKLKELKNKRKLRYIDGFLINFARKELDLDISVVIGNVYIKLNTTDRVLDLGQRVPNCTICCINDQSLIQEKCIAEVWRIKL